MHKVTIETDDVTVSIALTADNPGEYPNLPMVIESVIDALRGLGFSSNSIKGLINE